MIILIPNKKVENFVIFVLIKVRENTFLPNAVLNFEWWHIVTESIHFKSNYLQRTKKAIKYEISLIFRNVKLPLAVYTYVQYIGLHFQNNSINFVSNCMYF